MITSEATTWWYGGTRTAGRPRTSAGVRRFSLMPRSQQSAESEAGDAPAAGSGGALERDRALLRRWRDGDKEAGAELLREYRNHFYALCRRLGVTDQEQILDIFQDVVMETLKRLDDLAERIERSFAGWMAWRTREAVGRHRARSAPSEAIPESVSAPASASGFDTWEIIRGCWDGLPAREHEVFGLRYIQELSLQETALRLGSNANAVGQCIFRLSRKMRSCLGKHGIQEGAF